MRHNLNKVKERYAKEGHDFDEQLAWHHEHGWVIDIPQTFGMGYFYKEGDEVVLSVSYVEGDMDVLLRFSLDYDLDKVEFMRDFTGRMRRYDFRKFAKRIR